MIRRIAILGSSSVGKSSLTIQYVDGVFSDNYQPTINASYSKLIKYKSKSFQLEIHDTAGIDEYSLINTQFANIHGVILVYSITSQQSFKMLQVIRDKILQMTGLESIPIVIVGNKCDLQNRQVTFEDAKQLASQFGDKQCIAIESSAKLNKNIGTLF
eukprot:NODE_562_length_5998_cov_1.109849.p4 type:complete len:158 gc:universal NODE_562_length_5998_cov_1.109849:1655-1182(-)